jgi:hypothetical protein
MECDEKTVPQNIHYKGWSTSVFTYPHWHLNKQLAQLPLKSTSREFITGSRSGNVLCISGDAFSNIIRVVVHCFFSVAASKLWDIISFRAYLFRLKPYQIVSHPIFRSYIHIVWINDSANEMNLKLPQVIYKK